MEWRNRFDSEVASNKRESSEKSQCVPESELSVKLGKKRIYPACRIHQLFEQQARLHPQRAAVVFDGKCLNYEELNRRADRIAVTLIEAGVCDGMLVGICIERSTDMIAAIIAVWKAGAGYVPIDADYPSSRIFQIIEDSHIEVLLVSERTGKQSFPDAGVNKAIRRIRACDAAARPLTEAPASKGLSVDSIAYAIYTSGSTGVPKGISIEHRSAVNYFYALAERLGLFEINGPYQALHVASIAFDASVKQLVHLLNGGTLHILPEALRFDPPRFFDYLKRNRIRSFDITPSLMKLLLPYFQSRSSRDMPVDVLLGGEAVDSVLWKALQSIASIRAFNAYGPTECTVNTTVAQITPGGRNIMENAPHIGTPLANVSCYVLDAQRRILPLGQVGELYIGGAGVGRGYLNQRVLTDKKFVANPFQDGYGERLYKTGDQVRMLADGSMEYLGRIDNQVKVRGHRIELEDIERQLKQHERITEAAVLVTEQATLAAYVLADLGETVDREQKKRLINDVRGHLSSRLPAYMIPSSFMVMEKMPLTINGKIDRRALPDPTSLENLLDDYVAPRDESERRLIDIWEEILGLSGIGVRNNFFEMGGTSLSAIRMGNAIRDRLNINLPLNQIFSNPTVEQLRGTLDACVTVADNLGVKMGSLPRPRVLPLSSMEGIMWSISRYGVVCVQRCLRLDGELDQEALLGAISVLVERHELLRTTYIEVDGVVSRNIGTNSKGAIDVLDLSTVATESRPMHLEKQMLNDIESLHTDRPPLFRFTLLKTEAREHLLILTTHHLISDAVSQDILLHELARVYGAIRSKVPVSLPEHIQYADFSLWERATAATPLSRQRLSAWQAELDALKSIQPLRTAKPGTGSGPGWIPIEFPIALSRALERFGTKGGNTTFMIILTAVNVVLHQWFGLGSVLLDVPTEGRKRSELEHTMGYFVRQLLIANAVDGKQSFQTLVQSVKETTLEAIATQDELSVDIDQFAQAIGQAHLVLDFAPSRRAIHFHDLHAEWRPLPHAVTLRTMAASTLSTPMMFLAESGGRISGGFVFNRETHAEAELRKMITYFYLAFEFMLSNPHKGVDQAMKFL